MSVNLQEDKYKFPVFPFSIDTLFVSGVNPQNIKSKCFLIQ